ncbi:hypothetical protein CALCODRAFT_504111 [Calocera cornea HHB12733]|uniref:Uncharacterized protein n=1 Tax=Calocera cornea HHB12733 TaxID=1353952 RepID=A0A165CKM7_9BASI|nr:hypothetical protein CALCODRAFT_504111 [Calocera cornea HHB12733]
MYVDGLPCLFFIFSIVILVGLTTKPAAWLILLATWSAVQTAVLFTGIFTMRTKGIRNFWDWFDKHRSWAWPLTLFVRLGVWAAIITLMFLAHPSCAHDSPFFLALVPSQPSSNISSRRTHQTPEQQGETKCVVSMVSLAGAFVMSLCYVGLLGIVFFRYARRSRAEGEYPLLSS